MKIFVNQGYLYATVVQVIGEKEWKLTLNEMLPFLYGEQYNQNLTTVFPVP